MPLTLLCISRLEGKGYLHVMIVRRFLRRKLSKASLNEHVVWC